MSATVVCCQDEPCKARKSCLVYYNLLVCNNHLQVHKAVKQWLVCYLASLAGVAGCTDPVAALLASLTASDCCCAAHVTMSFQSGYADAQQAVEEKPDCCFAYAALGP